MAYRKKDKLGMGLHDIQVRVQRAMDMMAWNVLIFRRRPDGGHDIAEPMQLKWRDIGSGEGRVVEPTMCISEEIAGDIMDAVVSELGDMGIKTRNDSKIEGVLEAQSKHLEDMRRIIFMETDYEKETS